MVVGQHSPMRETKMRIFSSVLVAFDLVQKLSFKKALKQWRKVRLAYVLAIPFIIGIAALVFEWEFVTHILIAMGIETIAHHSIPNDEI
jgi:hypothetical protein